MLLRQDLESGQGGLSSNSLERPPVKLYSSEYSLAKNVRNPEKNEDRSINLPEAGLFAVIDGVGSGTHSGEVAEYIKNALSSRLAGEHLPQDKFSLVEYITNIILTLRDEIIVRFPNQGAATIALAKRVGNTNEFLAMNIGDCAMFLENKKGIQRLFQPGISPEALAQHLNKPYQIPGGDHFDTNKEMQFRTFTVDPTSRLVLTSDGIVDNLAEGEVFAAMNPNKGFSNESPAQKITNAAALRQQYFEHTGKKIKTPQGMMGKIDDKTAVVVSFGGSTHEVNGGVDSLASSRSPQPRTVIEVPEKEYRSTRQPQTRVISDFIGVVTPDVEQSLHFSLDSKDEHFRGAISERIQKLYSLFKSGDIYTFSARETLAKMINDFSIADPDASQGDFFTEEAKPAYLAVQVLRKNSQFCNMVRNEVSKLRAQKAVTTKGRNEPNSGNIDNAVYLLETLFPADTR